MKSFFDLICQNYLIVLYEEKKLLSLVLNIREEFFFRFIEHLMYLDYNIN